MIDGGAVFILVQRGLTLKLVLLLARSNLFSETYNSLRKYEGECLPRSERYWAGESKSYSCLIEECVTVSFPEQERYHELVEICDLPS